MSPKIRHLFIAVLFLFVFPLSLDNFYAQSRSALVFLLPLSGGIWLLLYYRSNQPAAIPKLTLPFFVFLLYQTLSLFFTPLPFYGLFWVICSWLVFLGFLMLAEHPDSNGQVKRLELIFIILSLTYLSVDALFILVRQWRWALISGSLFSFFPYGLRLSGLLMGNPNILGGYINLFLPLVVVHLIRQQGFVRRLLWTTILLYLLILHIASESRAAWMAVLFILFIFCIYFIHKRIHTLKEWQKLSWRHISRVIIPPIFVLILILLVCLPTLGNRITTSVHGTFDQRVDIWNYCVYLIKASPLWGHGPGSIPLLYALRKESIGESKSFHSHNLLLESTATTGLIGLLIFGWGLALFMRAFIKAWQHRKNNGNNTQLSLLAYAAILSSVLIQGVLDTLFGNFKFSIAVFFILALVYRLSPASEYYKIKKSHFLALLSGSLVLLTLGMFYSVRGYLPFGRGVQAASQGDWSTASQNICQAAQTNPDHTFYQFQCSLAQAYWAYETNDEQALRNAISYSRMGLEKDSFWYVHWANLASYEWQLGDHTSAWQHMQQAAQMAPNIDWLWLNLGWMEENLGMLEQAQEHYLNAYCLNPWYQNTGFFDKTALRKQIQSRTCPVEYDKLADNPFQTVLWEGIHALQNGNLAQAEQSFKDCIQINQADPLPYAYLALIHQYTGNEADSEKEIRTALFITDSSPRIHLIAAQIASSSQNNLDESIFHLSRMFDLLSQSTQSKSYYIHAYKYMGLTIDQSPYLIYPLMIDFKEALIQLEDKLQQREEFVKAEKIRKWISMMSISETP